MNAWRQLLLAILAAILLGGCAIRPVNPPIAHVEEGGYTLQSRLAGSKGRENLVILAFSGGGTRAAAFSYGVLEFLRRTDIVDRDGTRIRMLDAVDIITGVSGGSFTALAYGLYGEKLFDDYEQRFLKRNVQGEIIGRALNPGNWIKLASPAWGRSELAADLYDEILFNGATFGDLQKRGGPLVMATATDISTGSRLAFNQNVFNVLCSDLGSVRLSRAAASSSAVPGALSSVTINNYGGRCGYAPPAWTQSLAHMADPPPPVARAVRELKDLESYNDGTRRPYIHLVDGGVSDNLGMRGVLDALALVESLQDAGVPTRLDAARRIIVFVVNSQSSPPTDWDRWERPPGTLGLLLKATGVPIDHYSYEAVQLLNDISSRWQVANHIRQLAGCSTRKDAPVCAAVAARPAKIFAIDVSFAAHPDKAERDYLNTLPTSFVLPDEAVDRLRRAAGEIITASPDFQALLKDAGARLATDRSAAEGSPGVRGTEATPAPH